MPTVEISQVWTHCRIGTRPGKTENEDTCAVFSVPPLHIFIVADGMGGHPDGKWASQFVVEMLQKEIVENRAFAGVPDPQNQRLFAPKAHHPIRGLVQSVDRALYREGSKRHPGEITLPGTTLTMGVFCGEGLRVAHVGDSRAYIFRENNVFLLTHDHTVTQEKVDYFSLPLSEAATHFERSSLTRCLGTDEYVPVKVDLIPATVEVGDLLLLTTDGIPDLLAKVNQDHKGCDSLGKWMTQFGADVLAAGGNIAESLVSHVHQQSAGNRLDDCTAVAVLFGEKKA